MNIADAIKFNFPDAEMFRDYLVQNDSDGRGEYIKLWNTEVMQSYSASLIQIDTNLIPTVEQQQTWLNLAQIGIPNQERITAIKAQLATLDTFLPRSVEDLLESGAISVEQLSPENQERHARKLALRAELAELEIIR